MDKATGRVKMAGVRSGLPAFGLKMAGFGQGGQEGGLRVPSPGTEPCLPPAWKEAAAAQGLFMPRGTASCQGFQGVPRHTAGAQVVLSL